MIRFCCPVCGAVFQAGEMKAGAKVACPKCGQRLQIPIGRPEPPGSGDRGTTATASPRPPAPESNPFQGLSLPQQRPVKRATRGGLALILGGAVLLFLVVGGAAALLLGRGKHAGSATAGQQVAAAKVNTATGAKHGSDRQPSSATEPSRNGQSTNAKLPAGAPEKTSAAADDNSKRPEHQPADPASALDPSGIDASHEPPGSEATSDSKSAGASSLIGKTVNQDIPLVDVPSEDFTRRIVEAINTQRQAARLKPVTLDQELSSGCMAHARYLARNAANMSHDASAIHDEDPRLAGYTAAGLAEARVAAIVYREPLGLITGWQTGIPGPAVIRNANLRTIGVGLAKNMQGQWACVLDLASGFHVEHPGAVLYPRDDQDDVPLSFPGSEVPDPIPEARNKVAGYPITITFPPNVRVKEASAKLEDGSHQDVAVWFSAPDKPANRPYAGHQQNTICLFAKEPLKPGTTYRVHAKARVEGRPWQATWSFTTVAAVDRKVEVDLAVARVNVYRRLAGLAPVVLDAALSRACAAHAHYLVTNHEYVQTHHLNMNDEDTKLPGYTEEGRAAAKVAGISYGSPLAAVDARMHFYARPLLDPSLQRLGIGYAAMPPRLKISVIDFNRGRQMVRRAAQAVVYPANQQKEVPLLYPPKRHPSPVPDRDKGKQAGYAITAGFPWGARVNDVKARLANASGNAVDFWLSTPSRPAVRPMPQSDICLIPKVPLEPATTYTVSMTASVNGQPWHHTWRFHTTGHPELTQEEVAAKVLVTVNDFRKLAGLSGVTLDPALSLGCLAHARYLVRNADNPTSQGLSMHNEQPMLPGYTKEGQKAAKASVITNQPEPPDISVDGWMRTFYHRIPILDPGLKRIGFAYVRYPDQNWNCVMDVGSGKQ